MKQQFYVFFSLIFYVYTCKGGVEILSDGRWKLENTGCAQIECYDINRRILFSQNRAQLLKEDNSGATRLLEIRLHGQQMAYQKIVDISKWEKKISYSISKPLNKEKEDIALKLNLKSNDYSGKPIILDSKIFYFPGLKTRNEIIARKENITNIKLMLGKGFLTINIPKTADIELVNHQDKMLNGMLISFRDSEHARILDINLSYEPYKTWPIDFSKTVNTSLEDTVKGDSKGWTDQGPQNDMSSFQATSLKLPEVQFSIVNSNKNQVNNAIAIRSYFCNFYPQHVELPVERENCKTLFLLHTSAWSPPKGTVGYLKVNYRDGTASIQAVELGKDCADWHYPTQLTNAKIAWTGSNDTSPQIGLYYSAFPLHQKAIKSIEFSQGKVAQWFILAASVSPQEIILEKPRQVILRKTSDWRYFDAKEYVEPDSALDFSFLTDPPAGKYGRLKTVGELLFFEHKHEAIRFYGTNLCSEACFPTKDNAIKLASNLRKLGYNAVRIHHWDKFVIKDRPKNTLTINEEYLDRLFYLIYELKKNGIYISTDLFCNRTPKSGEFHSCPELSQERDYKLAVIMFPEVRENLKEFIRRVFTKVNPYTGLALGKDPALITIGIVNENTPNICLEQTGLCSKRMREIVHLKFKEYNQTHGRSIPEYKYTDEFRKFIVGLYDEFFRDMSSFIRGLGMTALIYDQNNSYNPIETSLNYDLVDKHYYWAHPSFGKIWHMDGRSAVERSARWTRFADGVQRILGKPYTLTELNHVYPNQYRAEDGVITGGFSGIQGYNGLFHFAYSHGRVPSPYIDVFDSIRDPVKWFSERIAMLLFSRGDVATEEKTIAIALPYQQYSPYFPQTPKIIPAFFKTGTVLHIGNGRFLPPLNEHVVAIYSLDPKLKDTDVTIPIFREKTPKDLIQKMEETGIITKRTVSSNLDCFSFPSRTIKLDSNKGTYAVITPKTEAFVMPAGKTLSGKHLLATAAKGFAVVMASALNGTSLKDANRILFFHITDVQMEGHVFLSEKRDRMKRYNRGKRMALHGIAKIAFTGIDSKKQYELFALDFCGKRIAPISFKKTFNQINFVADTFIVPQKVVFAYELIEKQ